MYTFVKTSHFIRKARKIIRKNPSLDTRISDTLHTLEQNPFSPSLKTHRALARLDGKPVFSSFVEKDFRILWRFQNGNISIIQLLDVGGHSGSGRVYK